MDPTARPPLIPANVQLPIPPRKSSLTRPPVPKRPIPMDTPAENEIQKVVLRKVSHENPPEPKEEPKPSPVSIEQPTDSTPSTPTPSTPTTIPILSTPEITTSLYGK